MAANRVSHQFVHASQAAAECKCGWPCCVAVVDEVISVRPTQRLIDTITIDRWFDCMLCGPWVHRLRVPRPTARDCEDLGIPAPKRGMVLALDPFGGQQYVQYPWDEGGEDVKET